MKIYSTRQLLWCWFENTRPSDLVMTRRRWRRVIHENAVRPGSFVSGCSIVWHRTKVIKLLSRPAGVLARMAQLSSETKQIQSRISRCIRLSVYCVCASRLFFQTPPSSKARVIVGMASAPEEIVKLKIKKRMKHAPQCLFFSTSSSFMNSSPRLRALNWPSREFFFVWPDMAIWRPKNCVKLFIPKCSERRNKEKREKNRMKGGFVLPTRHISKVAKGSFWSPSPT